MSSPIQDRAEVLFAALLLTVSSAASFATEPRLIGVSRIDRLPPVPEGFSANVDAQPIGIPVPVFEVISEEAIRRGSTRNTGPATAVVYRNSHDNGFFNPAKATTGAFTGNLLHLGNGFPPDGGEISGYDLLVYNSVSSPGGDAAATVSLWDGDPLGVIDTRISDPPQPIPGTTCTFSGMVKGGTGGEGCIEVVDPPFTCLGGFLDGAPCEDDTDCGLCPALPGDDIPECPGLFRLVCDFESKVAIPSRNVWMIVEWTEGCHVGWRWAFYEGPEIAAVGEENFCSDTCPTTPVPCVDMAIELVDGASQWSNIGVGTCCEDDLIVCDHTDCDPATGAGCECGLPTTCSDGEATDFDAWCYGAPTYFASFVASIFTTTETRFELVPVASSGIHRFEGKEIIMPDGGQTIELEVFAAGWDPDGNGFPALKVWQAQIDSSTYNSGWAGALTNSRPACTVDSDCPNNAEGELCNSTTCGGAWMECPEREGLCMHLPACDVSSPNPRCGSHNLFDAPIEDDGSDFYCMSLRLEASTDAKGTFEVGFLPDPATWMKDSGSAGVPLVAYLPAKITIEIGQCCDSSEFLCISDTVTEAECYAMGGDTFNPNKTCDDPCECFGDEECDDGNVCTDDHCTATRCYNTPLFDTETECCHPVTGETCTLDDENQCTTDYCSLVGPYGSCVNHVLPDGTECDDREPCLTVNDVCMEGVCGGNQIQVVECSTHEDCQSLTEGYGSCGPTGYCTCLPVECTPPDAVAEGPRYVAITPSEHIYRAAIRVDGVEAPASCVEGYVQEDGRLRQPDHGQGETPEDHAVFQRAGSTGWDVAHARGEGIVGGATYEVRLDCDPGGPGTFMSPAVTVTLPVTGDVGPPAGVVDFVDIAMIVDGFRGDWGTPVCCTTDADCALFGPTSICNTDWPGCETPIQTPGRCMSRTENVDLVGAFGCLPDRVIDFVDITAAVDAFKHSPDPCGTPCP
ncbi:MAG: hypothetical protein PVI86_08310 [Phycisphaerae bacterium]|jgi:hypothetical protein